jgi:hypothetical protein
MWPAKKVNVNKIICIYNLYISKIVICLERQVNCIKLRPMMGSMHAGKRSLTMAYLNSLTRSKVHHLQNQCRLFLPQCRLFFGALRLRC